MKTAQILFSLVRTGRRSVTPQSPNSRLSSCSLTSNERLPTKQMKGGALGRPAEATLVLET